MHKFFLYYKLVTNPPAPCKYTYRNIKCIQVYVPKYIK